jgi:5'-nucleotidase
MRILITNDDSVSASQLLPLIRWCQKLGEVTVVVPKIEQSGKSHGIEIRDPFMVHEMMLEDVPVYAVESTPADCVRYAVIARGMKFDVVISGINRGFNVGADMMYSGTVAAVCEAANLGLPAIALSTTPGYYEHAVEYLDMVKEYFDCHGLMDTHSLYNVNIPPQPKGVKITRQGGPYYSDDFELRDDGMCVPNGVCVYKATGDLSVDTDAVVEGYISITPLTINMTDLVLFRKLSSLN